MRSLLLLHGICSTGAVFGPVAGPGLKRLLEKDFRVMVGEVSGAEFDHHLNRELPVIWADACDRLGEAPGVVGYSLGGMLALTGQARGIIASPQVMIIAAPFAFGGIPFYPPLMRQVLRLAVSLGWSKIPIRVFARVLFWFFLLSDRGITPGLRLFHVLARRAGADVSVRALAQATRWVDSGTFLDFSGTHEYLTDFERVSAPVFFLAGARDRIAPPETMHAGFERIASRRKGFHILPEASHLDFVGHPLVETTAGLVRKWFLG